VSKSSLYLPFGYLGISVLQHECKIVDEKRCDDVRVFERQFRRQVG
jgi:hypothetical protein